MSPGSNRIPWPDYAKGIGILLVVVGHVLRGLVNSSILSDAGFEGFLDRWIYSFHMPLFFFISGIFADHSARRATGAYMVDKVKVVLYPYLVWSLLQGLVQLILSAHTNANTTFRDLVAVLYQPPAQFWFLYILFIVMLIFLFFKKGKVSALGFFLFSVAGYLALGGLYLGPWNVVYMVCQYMIYFGLGVFLSDRVQGLYAVTGEAVLWGIGLAALGLVTLCVVMGIERFLMIAPLVATLGIFAVTALAMAMGRRGIAKFVEGWGMVSLQIYVAHTLASAGFRIILQKAFGLDLAWVHVLGGVCFGMYAPVLLDRFCNRVGFRYLFSLR
jgi:fucose 4-O-acetylase-like acetyltransferase